MRYTLTEKLEIIRLVEQSSLPRRRTLAHLGIPRSTFYAWQERYLARGVCNRLPEVVAEAVAGLAAVIERVARLVCIERAALDSTAISMPNK